MVLWWKRRKSYGGNRLALKASAKQQHFSLLIHHWPKLSSGQICSTVAQVVKSLGWGVVGERVLGTKIKVHFLLKGRTLNKLKLADFN